MVFDRPATSLQHQEKSSRAWDLSDGQFGTEQSEHVFWPFHLVLIGISGNPDADVQA